MILLTFKTLPVTTNRLYGISRTGRRFTTARMGQSKHDIGWEATAQFRKKPLEGPLEVTITTFWPDKRKRDVDNTKGFIDALSGIVWADDSQIQDLHQKKRFDKENPRVEVVVKDFEA